MKPQGLTIAKMKQVLALQSKLRIERLAAYEKVMGETSIDFSQVTIPKAIQKRFRDWIESQIILERSYIQNYAK